MSELDIRPGAVTPGVLRFASAILGWNTLRGVAQWDRYSEVVQCGQGLWLHSTGRRGKDVFVHISAVEKAGFIGLAEVQRSLMRSSATAAKSRLGIFACEK